MEQIENFHQAISELKKHLEYHGQMANRAFRFHEKGKRIRHLEAYEAEEGFVIDIFADEDATLIEIVKKILGDPQKECILDIWGTKGLFYKTKENIGSKE